MFDATYRELSNGDLKFPRAMLPDAYGSTLTDVSARIGARGNYPTKYKSRLLNRGIIGERPNGALDSDLPGFREYLHKRERSVFHALCSASSHSTITARPVRRHIRCNPHLERAAGNRLQAKRISTLT